MATSVILPFDSKGQPISIAQSPGEGLSHKKWLYNSWDFMLGEGKKVLAVVKGVVVDFREVVADGDSSELGNHPSVGSGAIGNFVTLKHEINGAVFYTSYFHLQKNSIPLEIGQTVQQGQVIGLVGNTGHRDGTHLHFQVASTATMDAKGNGWFGATSYGAIDGDAGLQIIADASNTNANKNLINFKGYESSGYNLPSTVKSTVVSPFDIKISDASGYEGNPVTFTVSLVDGKIADADITIKYFTSPGEGANGASSAANDYYGVTNGSVTIKKGQSSATFNIVTKEDSSFEADEKFVVNLSSTSKGTIVDSVGQGTIRNDDAAPPAAPKASISNASTTEGGNLNYIVSLDKAATAATTIYYETVAGSAVSNDFAGKSGYVTIAKGATSATLTVGTVNDLSVEPTETMSVVLRSATNGVIISKATGTGTIYDNDVAPVTPPKFSILDGSANEGDIINFTVTLDKAADRAITITYTTYKGSGDTGANYNGDADYVGGISKTITIPKGATSGTIQIATNEDQKVESNERFSVNIDAVTHGTINDARADGTIRNDDAAPVSNPDISIQNLRIDDSSVSRGQTVRLNYDGVNLTNGTSSSSDTFIFLSRDQTLSNDDTYIKYVSLLSMSAFERDGEATSFVMPSNLGTGRWYAIAWADGRLAVAELNEGNNSAWVGFDVI